VLGRVRGRDRLRRRRACGIEACDDGNTAACNGCSGACLVEVGWACSDGMVSASCGEECDPPAPDGVTAVTVTGPLHLHAPILGGAFGHLCFRLTSCAGIVDCTGGTAAAERDQQAAHRLGRGSRPS
jgi:cysteine-rich repeat protein